jgi:hypothetical protein
MPLETILSLCPLVLTFLAWRSQRKTNPPLTSTRRLLFSLGLVLSIVGSLAVFLSWLQPFPLLPDGQGGYSDIRNFALSEGALVVALTTIALAAFGRSMARLILLASGLVLTIGAFGAALSRG